MQKKSWHIQLIFSNINQADNKSTKQTKTILYWGYGVQIKRLIVFYGSYFSVVTPIAEGSIDHLLTSLIVVSDLRSLGGVCSSACSILRLCIFSSMEPLGALTSLAVTTGSNLWFFSRARHSCSQWSSCHSLRSLCRWCQTSGTGTPWMGLNEDGMEQWVGSYLTCCDNFRSATETWVKSNRWDKSIVTRSQRKNDNVMKQITFMLSSADVLLLGKTTTPMYNAALANRQELKKKKTSNVKWQHCMCFVLSDCWTRLEIKKLLSSRSRWKLSHNLM